MSFHVFFDFSAGLNDTITVPRGTVAACREHVRKVEETLGITSSKYLDNPLHWDRPIPGIEVTDKVLCRTALSHNRWVRWLYDKLGEWSADAPEDGEPLSPDDAQSFWHGLEMIDVPPERWTDEYYRDRMEHLYEVFRGRPSEGVSLDEKALTTKQAAAVIRLFEFLDPADQRLEVPRGHDRLAASSDGGYLWCEKCGCAIDPDDAPCRKRACPLREDPSS